MSSFAGLWRGVEGFGAACSEVEVLLRVEDSSAPEPCHHGPLGGLCEAFKSDLGAPGFLTRWPCSSPTSTPKDP